MAKYGPNWVHFKNRNNIIFYIVFFCHMFINTYNSILSKYGSKKMSLSVVAYDLNIPILTCPSVKFTSLIRLNYTIISMYLLANDHIYIYKHCSMIMYDNIV